MKLSELKEVVWRIEDWSSGTVVSDPEVYFPMYEDSENSFQNHDIDSSVLENNISDYKCSAGLNYGNFYLPLKKVE